jgi:hypothetical protein
MPAPSDHTPMHEVVACLARGVFDEFIGKAEGSQVDFKKAAYNLEIGKDQIDFVADIASFANARGGILVLGVETGRAGADGEMLERATKVVGLKRAGVSLDSYQKFAQAHIHPLVKGLAWSWYAGTAAGQEVELLAIIVEAQDRMDGPFLVDRSTLSSSGKPTPWALGWPTRNNADTHWESPARIQQLVAIALRLGPFNSGPEPDISNDVEAEEQLGAVSADRKLLRRVQRASRGVARPAPSWV